MPKPQQPQPRGTLPRSHDKEMARKASKNKNNDSRTTPAQTPATSDAHSTREQQTLLNIFSDAFANVLSSERFPTLLQEIKQALYNRDFGTAFSSAEYLEAYAARWSPTRALCYASIFSTLQEHIDKLVSDAATDEYENAARPPANEAYEAHPKARLRMLCVGGCAAEHVALASFLARTKLAGTLTLLDAAPWKHVTSTLQTQLTTAPPLSKYASAAAKTVNKPLVDQSQLESVFTHANVLSLGPDALSQQVGSVPSVVTLMFTLNELYTEGGVGKTTKFLRNLGQVLPHKSLLLVVDSPGSYSEAAVGKDRKRYPMQWLLNHTLLESETPGSSWEKLESEDSLWFRLPEGLSYPIPLENMRYQMHLYRIVKPT
ncbi:hypothetical protein NOR_03473 [Metarhizium rileyi]|uniref:25S rRNA (Uridine(2843)-N(3))-methyltransferase n=1 Tax=Metarhizium rileyi (strain RCEF 4871) TaxID=1649241 RepID=A0A167FSC0_METRR|nr:hypothetical protein NOR_03473 [Metarhizium rileyi RCEF 4871]